MPVQTPMHMHTLPMPLMSAASDDQVREALRAAREIFGRTLACWASDLLALQSRGGHLATWSSSSSPRFARGLRKAA